MKNLLVIGLIIFLVGSFANGLLVRAEIGGLLRELMRLVVLSGIALFIYGLIKRPNKK